MSLVRQSSKKGKHRSKALPVLGIAGLSLSLASGASAFSWRTNCRRAEAEPGR
jgi:hypothetical protein